MLFNVRRSRRYHLWRVKFYQRFNTLRILVFLITSSASFALIVTTSGWEYLLPWTSGIATFMALLEVSVKMTAREGLHRDLAKSFVYLEKDILTAPTDMDDKAWQRLEAHYLELEAEEPPVINVLNDLCYNEEVRARYVEQEWDRYIIPVNRLRQIFACMVDLAPHSAKMRTIVLNKEQ